MEDGVSFVRVLLQRVDRSGSGKDEQFDFTALGFELHFFHHRQGAVGPCADYQPATFSGYFLLRGERSASEGIAKFFGGFFLALADLTAVNHHVVLVGDAIDPDGTEGKIFETHMPSPAEGRRQ